VEPQCQNPTGVNHHIVKRSISRGFSYSGFKPAFVSAVKEDEAKIMYFPIVFAMFESFGVPQSEFAPTLIVGLFIKDPHHPRQETIAPTSPRRLCMTPTSAVRIERIKVRIALYQSSHLSLRKVQRVVYLIEKFLLIDASHLVFTIYGNESPHRR